MKLYFFAPSPYSQKVLIALIEKKVAVEQHPINLMEADEREKLKEIYPLGKLPILVGEDVFVPESSIIIEYLEDTYLGQGTELIPETRQDARRVRFKSTMVDNHLTPSMRTLYFESKKPVEEQNSKLLQNSRNTIDIMYDYMNRAAHDNTWIHGDGFTMADCTVIPSLRMANMLHPISDDKSDLLAYLEKGLARGSVKAVCAEA